MTTKRTPFPLIFPKWLILKLISPRSCTLKVCWQTRCTFKHTYPLPLFRSFFPPCARAEVRRWWQLIRASHMTPIGPGISKVFDFTYTSWHQHGKDLMPFMQLITASSVAVTVPTSSVYIPQPIIAPPRVLIKCRLIGLTPNLTLTSDLNLAVRDRAAGDVVTLHQISSSSNGASE